MLENGADIRFIQMEFGCGDIGGEEFYGIIDDKFLKSTVPNGIWLTMNERQKIGLSNDYVIVLARGDGTYNAIDTSRIGDEGECPVVLLSPDGQKLEDVSEDFGKFFYDTISVVL